MLPSAERFGAPGWFEQLPLPVRLPKRPAFVVEHRVGGCDEGSLVHQQVFDGQRLVAWVPGQAVSGADLVLVRDAETDAGDLLGRMPATEVAHSTSLLVASKSTDLFGLASVARPGLDEHTAGVVDIGVAALNTPFGDVETAVRLNPDGTQELVRRQEADCQITICAGWAHLLGWMHSDVLMGHLMGKNLVHLEGSMTVNSYAVGHICWPKTPQDQQWSAQFFDTMEVYTRYRLSPDYVALMDQIEEATA